MLMKLKDYRRERFDLEDGKRVRCKCPRCQAVTIMEWGFVSPFIASTEPGWRCLGCDAFFRTSVHGILAWNTEYYSMNPKLHYFANDDVPYYRLDKHESTGVRHSEFANSEYHRR